MHRSTISKNSDISASINSQRKYKVYEILSDQQEEKQQIVNRRKIVDNMATRKSIKKDFFS